MPTIVSLAPAILEAGKTILQAELDWQSITRKAANSQEIRSALEAELFHSPSPKTLAELVAFDNAQRTLGDLQARIVAGQITPGKLIGRRLKDLLTGPLTAAVAELESELSASIKEDERLALEHGMDSNAGPRSRAIGERLEVAKRTLVQVSDGGGNPLKVFAKLGFALSDQVDAESMSASALAAVRNTQHVLAKSA